MFQATTEAGDGRKPRVPVESNIYECKITDVEAGEGQYGPWWRVKVEIVDKDEDFAHVKGQRANTLIGLNSAIQSPCMKAMSAIFETKVPEGVAVSIEPEWLKDRYVRCHLDPSANKDKKGIPFTDIKTFLKTAAYKGQNPKIGIWEVTGDSAPTETEIESVSVGENEESW